MPFYHVGQMDRCSAWKFINPPSACVAGVLVDRHGARVANEAMYGATLADELIQVWPFLRT